MRRLEVRAPHIAKARAVGLRSVREPRAVRGVPLQRRGEGARGLVVVVGDKGASGVAQGHRRRQHGGPARRRGRSQGADQQRQHREQLHARRGGESGAVVVAVEQHPPQRGTATPQQVGHYRARGAGAPVVHKNGEHQGPAGVHEGGAQQTDGDDEVRHAPQRRDGGHEEQQAHTGDHEGQQRADPADAPRQPGGKEGEQGSAHRAHHVEEADRDGVQVGFGAEEQRPELGEHPPGKHQSDLRGNGDPGQPLGTDEHAVASGRHRVVLLLLPGHEQAQQQGHRRAPGVGPDKPLVSGRK